jgi:hypothetical protein
MILNATIRNDVTLGLFWLGYEVELLYSYHLWSNILLPVPFSLNESGLIMCESPSHEQL